ncbi:hypothetical protein P0Y67_15915 [Photobacterium sp. SP02]
MKTIYTTSAKASAGRNGQVKSDDGLLETLKALKSTCDTLYEQLSAVE